MKKFFTDNPKGNIFGGITAGIVALPLALAFGVQSGLGPEAGLYGAIGIGIIAAIFGGTPTQISGPTAPMTVVTVLVVAAFVKETGSIEAGMGLILLTFVLAGAFLVLLGILRVGQYVKYIPYPVVSGFMSGIGVIIAVKQLFPLIGHKSPGSIIDIFLEIGTKFDEINWASVLLAGITIGIIYGFPKITKKVPATLVALVVATLIPVFIDMNLETIAAIPPGLPAFKLGTILDVFTTTDHPWGIVLKYAGTLAALGAIDSLLTSIVADNITKTKHDSNRELIGQGLGNMAAGLLGGIPGAGATVRTVVNAKSGGTGKLSGVVHGALLLLILVALGDFASKIPLAVLAGIMITVGFGIIDYRGLKHLKDIPKSDAAVMIFVLLCTVFVDLLYAVGIGMVMASVLFMKKIADVSEEKSLVKPLTEEEVWEDEKDFPAALKGKVFIKHIYGPMTFGFAAGFKALVDQLPDDTKVVIMRMDRVPYMDQSGLYVMEEAIIALEKRKVKVLLAGLHSQPLDMMKNILIVPDLVSEDRIFDTFTECRDALNTWVEIVPGEDEAGPGSGEKSGANG